MGGWIHEMSMSLDKYHDINNCLSKPINQGGEGQKSPRVCKHSL